MLCLSLTQILAVLNKNRLVDQRHPFRTCCEFIFPLLILGGITFAFLSLDEPLIDFLQGGVEDKLVYPSLLPAIGTAGDCDGTPGEAELRVLESPEGAPLTSCFGHLDGRSIAIQCRCRTLALAGPPDLREGFHELLLNTGIMTQIQEFTDKWRAEKMAQCPDRPLITFVDGEVDVGREICGMVKFINNKNIEVKMDTTPDAGVYRSTPAMRQNQFQTIFSEDECDMLPWWVQQQDACPKMYDLYRRHAHADLQLLSSMFLAKQGSANLKGIPKLAKLYSANSTITVYNLPRPERMEKERDQNFVGDLSSWIAFFAAFPFVLWVFVLVSGLIRERELRQKEGMKVMGLRSSSFYTSWVVWVAIRAAFLAIVMGLLALMWPVSGTGFLVMSWIIISGLMHTFAFCAVCSTCFSNERTGAMLVAMLYFLVMIPAVVRGVSDLGSVLTILMSFPSYWTIIGLKHVIYMETMDWADGLELDGRTTGSVVLLGILFQLGWYFIYLYLEQVVRQSVGQSRSVFFLFHPSFWREMLLAPQNVKSFSVDPIGLDPQPTQLGSTAGEEISMHRTNSKVQVVDDVRLLDQEKSGKCVQIKDLEVVFKGVHNEEIRAVDGLTFTMYMGQIFVLLGHNGAGKTTTIGILSGLVQPTKGTVTIMNRSLPAQLQQVRKSLGFCPQHNVLWDELTCLEHMTFFLSLRGSHAGDSRARTTISKQVLTEVGLGPRINYRSRELSGGMKRKLSVAIAFNGNPDFVILDEPTSGMDPFSRRTLWDFIKHRRAERAVLLTTHFMDEADVLGDRIGIMAHGQLQTCGDPQYLKRNFGCGYIVSIVLQKAVPVRDSRHNPMLLLRSAIESHLSLVEIDIVGKEMLVRVPFTATSCLPLLFKLLDEAMQEGNVASYGAGVSSLEEVFLRIADCNLPKMHMQHVRKSPPAVSLDGPPAQQDTWPPLVSHSSNLPNIVSLDGPPVIHDAWPSPSSHSSNLMNSPISVPRHSSPPFVDEELFMEPSGFALTSLPSTSNDFVNQGKALLLRRVRSAMRDRKSFCLVCGVAPLTMLFGCLICYLMLQALENQSVEFHKDIPMVDDDKVVWASLNNTALPYVAAGQRMSFSEMELQNVDLNLSNLTLSRELTSGLAFNRPLFAQNITPPATYCAEYENSTATNTNQSVSDQVCHDRWQRHVVLFAEKLLATGSEWNLGVLFIDDHVTLWANPAKYIHSVSVAVNLFINQIANSSFGVRMGIVRMEPDDAQNGLQISQTDLFRYLMPVLLVSIAFAFIPTGVMQFVMMEKTTGAKNQLLISGCKYNAYWSTNLAWDCLFGLLPVLLASLFFVVFQFEHLYKELGLVLFFLIFFVPGACGLSYVSSQLISSESMGTTAMLALNGLLGSIFVVMVMVADLARALLFFTWFEENPANLQRRLEEDTTLKTLSLIHDIGMTFGMLLPGFSLAAGLFRISMRHLFAYSLLPALVSMNFLTTVENLIPALLPASLGPFGFVASAYLNSFVTVAGNATSSITETAKFLDEQLLPPITLSMTFENCYFGSDFIGPFISGEQLVGPLSLQMPCNFLRPTDGTSDGIGSVVEQIMSLFVVGDSMIHILVLAVMWPLLALLVETLVQNPNLTKHFVPRDEVPPELQPSTVDPDVQAESDRVARLCPEKQIICVKNLRRVYKRPNLWLLAMFAGLGIAEIVVMLVMGYTIYFLLAVNLPLGFLAIRFSHWWGQAIYWRVPAGTHAVRGVSWASDTGMVFGLLGVNGAGKTSTFEMMAGLRTPSEGEVKVVGMDVLTQVEACRRYIGYCPQFDCLISHLTPVDHLYLFGRIKGLQERELANAVECKLSEMQLNMYRDRYAGTLSGGNKRKLSVAIALIGEPPIVFLDEPSTGMDPFARRFMWSVINDVAERRKRSVVVLTTHSMEEGTALCSTLTIQVDGHLRCFGSAQQLQSRYGSGYEVPVKFKAVNDFQRQAGVEELTAHGLNLKSVEGIDCDQVFKSLEPHFKEKLRRALSEGAPFGHGTLQVPCEVFIDWWILDSLVQQLANFLAGDSQKQVMLLEHHGLSARFRLPHLESSHLASLFESLLSNDALYLDDFAVSQGSLETIFNQFARQAGGARGMMEELGSVSSACLATSEQD